MTTNNTPAIQTVVSYQTRDGERFNSLPEAQTHARTQWFEAIITTASKENPEFARLDRDLLIKFLFSTGAHLAHAINNGLSPAPLAPSVVVTNTPRPGEPETARVREPVHQPVHPSVVRPNPAGPVPQEPILTRPAAQPPIPAARADASPPRGAAEVLMNAAQRGLASIRGERDPGFPPQTKPVEPEINDHLEAELSEAMANGFTGARRKEVY